MHTSIGNNKIVKDLLRLHLGVTTFLPDYSSVTWQDKLYLLKIKIQKQQPKTEIRKNVFFFKIVNLTFSFLWRFSECILFQLIRIFP